MSSFERHYPELAGLQSPPAREEPLEVAGPDCYCGHDCEMPCWQRVGIAPPCQYCGCDETEATL